MAAWGRTGFELSRTDVRYEDAHLLIVAKPSGLAVHATVDPHRPHLFGAAQRWVARTHGDVAGQDLALHHRLDVDTSGLVLLCKRPALNAAVAALFAERSVQKTYRAKVRSSDAAAVVMPERIENFLGRDRSVPRQTRYTAVRSGGKKAITSLEVLSRPEPDAALLQVQPHTGRAHQIRVHCAEAGAPIEGDRFYGGAPAPRLLLHAWRLRFVHPATGEAIEVTDPPPPSLQRD